VALNCPKTIAYILISGSSVTRKSAIHKILLQSFADVRAGLAELQQFAMDLRQTVARNTTIGNLCTVFGVLEYAERCKMRVSGVKPSDLELGSRTERTAVPFFTREQVALILSEARDPFKTLFTLAWNTGMRLICKVDVVQSEREQFASAMRVLSSAALFTRIVRQPKKKCSNAVLPMPSALETALRNYIRQWKPNSKGILFATRDGLRSRSRDNVVKNGLKPVLRKLGIPDANTGIHAFRHGLAAQLVEASVPLSVLQKQLRHADVATTLRIYTHAIPQSQRDAMENISVNPISTSISTVLKVASK